MPIPFLRPWTPRSALKPPDLVDFLNNILFNLSLSAIRSDYLIHILVRHRDYSPNPPPTPDMSAGHEHRIRVLYRDTNGYLLAPAMFLTS